MYDLIKEARRVRPYIVKAAVSLDDKEISEVPELCDTMKYDNSLIPYQTRINWYGKVKRAVVDLWDTEDNNPDNAPSLWEGIAYKQGYRYIPETITAASAFTKDELGWWKETSLYKSLIDANVWTPEAYPAGWELVRTEESPMME